MPLDLNDFSRLYTFYPATYFFTLWLEGVGTNNKSVSLDIESLFIGNISAIYGLYLNEINADLGYQVVALLQEYRLYI